MGVALPTLVLPKLWYQLPLSKGQHRWAQVTTPLIKSTFICFQVHMPCQPLRTKPTLPQLHGPNAANVLGNASDPPIAHLPVVPQWNRIREQRKLHF